MKLNIRLIITVNNRLSPFCSYHEKKPLLSKPFPLLLETEYPLDEQDTLCSARNNKDALSLSFSSVCLFSCDLETQRIKIYCPRLCQIPRGLHRWPHSQQKRSILVMELNAKSLRSILS